MKRKQSNWSFRQYVESILRDEKNSVELQNGEDVRVALAFPNYYPLGISNLGYQTVYRLFNEIPGVRCERIFVYEPPLGYFARTLESQRQLNEFDIVAFSLCYEVDTLNLFRILENGRIPLLTRDREGNEPLVIVGGVITFLNPLPLAPFVDVFLLGEGEELISSFVDVYRECKSHGFSRHQCLSRLAAHENFFVPSISPKTHRKLKVHHVNVRAHRPAFSPIITPRGHFGEMFLVEVGRGCSRRCRFCAASYIFQTYRSNEITSLKQTIQAQTPSERITIGLVGSALADYPALPQLCRWLLQNNYRFSFSSFRLDKLTPEILQYLENSQIQTVTGAPEAGTERLRRIIGKPLSDFQLYEVVEAFAATRIPRLKLYFLIGLPSEEDADIEGIIVTVKNIHRILLTSGATKKQLRVSINAFIPKPFTPFQWAPMDMEKNIIRKRRYIERELRQLKEVTVASKSLRGELLQTLITLGDERVGLALLESYRYQKNIFKLLPGYGVDSSSLLYQPREFGYPFPWDIIDYPIPKDKLWRDFVAV